MNSFPGGGELKTVSGGTDRFENFKWAVAFLGEFLHGSKGSNVGAFEPYFRTNFKRGEVIPFGVKVRFHNFRSLCEGSDGIISSIIQLGCSIGSGRVVRRKWSLLPSGRITEHEVERGVLYAGVKSTIHYKLGERQQQGPVILLVVTIEPKVLFEFLIGIFCLAIYL